LELLKDYNLEIHYHLGKAKVVADALNRRKRHGLNTIVITQPHILRALKHLAIELVSHGQSNALLLALEVQHSLVKETKSHQNDDAKLWTIR